MTIPSGVTSIGGGTFEAWGDSRNYDLVVNSSRVGVDGCVEQVKHYIDLVRKYHK